MTPRFLPIWLITRMVCLWLACSGMQFRELDGPALLNVPLITCEAVEGIQINRHLSHHRDSQCVALERLCKGIRDEQADGREGENWSIAKE